MHRIIKSIWKHDTRIPSSYSWVFFPRKTTRWAKIWMGNRQKQNQQMFLTQLDAAIQAREIVWPNSDVMQQATSSLQRTTQSRRNDWSNHLSTANAIQQTDHGQPSGTTLQHADEQATLNLKGRAESTMKLVNESVTISPCENREGKFCLHGLLTMAIVRYASRQ